MPDFNASQKTTHEMRVSLRGKLSQDYLYIRSKDPVKASRWIRKLVTEATQGHAQLLYRMEPDPEHGGQKFVVGLKSEVGKFADW